MDQANQEIEGARERIKVTEEELQRNGQTFSWIFFKGQMNAFKERFSHLMKEIKKEKIKWEFTSNSGDKFKGEYEGEVKDGKPDGMGRWKRDGQNWIIEAEWKEGLLHGRAV